MNYRALVIGAGISGMQAALDIVNSGFEVVLVEKEPSIGGHMAQLSEVFPTLECSQCTLTPRTAEVRQHPNIQLLTLNEVVDVERIAGPTGERDGGGAAISKRDGDGFRVRIKTHPRYVNQDRCTACGDCAEACPVVAPNEFDRGLAARRPIYIRSPQAVPAVYQLDPEACLGLFWPAADVLKPAAWEQSTTARNPRLWRWMWLPSSSPRATRSTRTRPWPRTSICRIQT